MATILDSGTCPQCLFPDATFITDWKDGKVSLSCPRCGHEFKHVPVCPKGKGPHLRVYNHPGYGAFTAEAKGCQALGRLNTPTTRAAAEQWLQTYETLKRIVLILTIVEDGRVVFLRGSEKLLQEIYGGNIAGRSPVDKELEVLAKEGFPF